MAMTEQTSRVQSPFSMPLINQILAINQQKSATNQMIEKRRDSFQNLNQNDNDFQSSQPVVITRLIDDKDLARRSIMSASSSVRNLRQQIYRRGGVFVSLK
eukprot:403335256